eukprot:m.77923 g.77923  ORF g.77923 m.77923 type:complete len:287 (-) comp12647_c0_seq3:60-920(-)
MSEADAANSVTISTTRAGWLQKWTNPLQGYQDRWVVLDGKTVSYYLSPHLANEQVCRGSIALKHATIKILHNSSRNFEVLLGERCFHLRASNEIERQAWISALQLAKNPNSEPRSPIVSRTGRKELLSTPKSKRKTTIDTPTRIMNSFVPRPGPGELDSSVAYSSSEEGSVSSSTAATPRHSSVPSLRIGFQDNENLRNCLREVLTQHQALSQQSESLIAKLPDAVSEEMSEVIGMNAGSMIGSTSELVNALVLWQQKWGRLLRKSNAKVKEVEEQVELSQQQPNA